MNELPEVHSEESDILRLYKKLEGKQSAMKNYFNKELIKVNLDVASSIEAINVLSELLRDGNYVRDTFFDAVIEREKKYPTGIPLDPYGIAIPHTDGIYVKKVAIAVGILAKPIKFGMMGGEGEIDVDMVFLLALKACESQISLLQCFSDFFQCAEKINKLRAAATRDEIYEVLHKEIQIEE